MEREKGKRGKKGREGTNSYLESLMESSGTSTREDASSRYDLGGGRTTLPRSGKKGKISTQIYTNKCALHWGILGDSRLHY